MKAKVLTVGLLAAIFSVVSVQTVAIEIIHVRLKDRLDRPGDGCCFDILGTGNNLRVELPLFAHNCKPRATNDSAVIYTERGQLVFPGAGGICVTAFGVNDTVLPGTSVLLRPCDYRIAFFQTANLQQFDYLDNGQLRLRGYDLCLAVGNESSSTYSPDDRWRVLSLETCNEVELNLSAWDFVPL